LPHKLRYDRTHLGKTISLTDGDKELLITEYQPLRDEVNRTIDRMNQHEAICAAFAFSLIFASQTSSADLLLPAWIIQITAAILGFLTAVYGAERNKVFRGHLEMLEKYLADLERRFSGDFGWSNFYSLAVDGTRVQRQTGTRNIFWHALKFVAFGNLFLILFAVWYFNR
jgi:hypothetical protein